jgi:predicted flap endonuclease-1-like 5' DNA nuclease
LSIYRVRLQRRAERVNMATQTAFVFGLLTGIVVYWFVYRIFWQRWQAAMARDQAYLQEKIKSSEFTIMGLERHIHSLKGELTGLRSKIHDLERENRQALAKIAEAGAEKEAMLAHLDTLRAELGVYKKLAADSIQVVPPPTQPLNHKPHEPALPVQQLEPVLVGLNGTARNGSTNHKIEAPPKASSNGKAKLHLPPEPLVDPVVVIARPRMDGDRLDIIQGIGPAIVKKLRQQGIDTFLALSRLSADELKKMIGARAARRVDVNLVIEQAGKLARSRK